MSEKTLGQVAYEGFTAVRYDGSLTTAWTHPSVAHKAWEATGQAVAAHVANPDAADYDSAAEIMRLRGLLDAHLPLWEHYGSSPAPSAEPQPAPELAASRCLVTPRRCWLVGGAENADADLKADLAATMADLDRLRERIARTAAKLDADALVTAPSKKSEIQAEAAARLRETLGDGA